MTQKTFDLEKALNGHLVQTRDGRKITDLKIVNAEAPHSADDVDEHEGEEYLQGLTAIIHNKSGEHKYCFYHNGGSHLYGLETEADLVTEF